MLASAVCIEWKRVLVEDTCMNMNVCITPRRCNHRKSEKRRRSSEGKLHDDRAGPLAYSSSCVYTPQASGQGIEKIVASSCHAVHAQGEESSDLSF